MNGKQIKLAFLGKPYEEMLTLMDATTITIGKWISDLEANTPSFLPSQSVSVDEVNAQKADSNQVNIKLELYPNRNVNPVVLEWMAIFSKIMDDFLSLYIGPKIGGVVTVSAQTHIEVLAKLKIGFTSLKTKREQVVTVMAKELKIPK